MDGDRHVIEYNRDRGHRLVHSNLNPAQPHVGRAPSGDAMGEGFDRVEGWSGEFFGDRSGDRAIIHGVIEPVRRTHQGQIKEEGHIGTELLTEAALMGQDPVMPEGADSGESDAVIAWL